MYAALEQFLIKPIPGELFEKELQKVIGFYHNEFNGDILRIQLGTLRAMIGQGEGSVNTFHDIQILVKQLKKPIRNFISEVVKLIKLVIAMPATNSVSEHSFNAMRCLYSPFQLTSLIYAEKFEFENPAIMEDKQCKQMERFLAVAKESDRFLIVRLLSKQIYKNHKVKTNSIQGCDPYQIKKEELSVDISKFPPVT